MHYGNSGIIRRKVSQFQGWYSRSIFRPCDSVYINWDPMATPPLPFPFPPRPSSTSFLAYSFSHYFLQIEWTQRRKEVRSKEKKKAEREDKHTPYTRLDIYIHIMLWYVILVSWQCSRNGETIASLVVFSFCIK